MTRTTATAEELAAGHSREGDLQSDLLDLNDHVGDLSNQGVEAEERREAEERSIESVDVLQGLREMQSGDPIRWHISRVGDMDPARNGHLAVWTTAQLTQDAVRDVFGGGTYRVRGHFSNGQYAAQRTITVAADAPRRSMGAGFPGVSGMSSGAATGGNFNLSEFMATQEARDAQRRREQDERDQREEKRRERERADRKDLMIAALPTVGSVLAALLGRNQGPDLAGLIVALKGPTMPEMMQGLASLKALVPEQTTDPLDKAFKIMELLQDRSGGGGETNWTDVFKELVKSGGPVLGAIAGRALEAGTPAGGMPGNAPPGMTARVLPNAPPRPLPNTVPGNAAAQPLGENDVNVAQMLKLQGWLRQMLGVLITKAGRGADPGLYGDYLIDNIPDDLDPAIVVEALSRPDWFAILSQFDGRVAPHVTWFDQLRAHVLRTFESMRQEAEGGAVTGRREVLPIEPGGREQVIVHGPESAPAIDMPMKPPSLTGE